MSLAWKVHWGHPVIWKSVCPSVYLFVPLTSKVQYLKFGWWYSSQTWTVCSSKGCSHFIGITYSWASFFHKHLFSFSFPSGQNIWYSREYQKSSHISSRSWGFLAMKTLEKSSKWYHILLAQSHAGELISNSWKLYVRGICLIVK